MLLTYLLTYIVLPCVDISHRRNSPVGHHYRGAKMALWLDLIPRLHRSDDLDARYHQLDNYADRSSFDEDGTRLPEGTELALLRSLAAARTERSNSSVSGPPVTGSTSTASGSRRRLAATITTPLPTTTVASRRSASPMTAATVDDGRKTGVGVMSLAVTVGIGCGLLVVNAAVLASLYCKRGRLGKMREQLALMAPPGESAQLVDRSAYNISRETVDVDGSSSLTASGLLDGGVASTSLIPAPPPPPPPEPLTPRRRTYRTPSRRSSDDPDRVALTSTPSTKPDSAPSSHINSAILMSVTSRALSGDVINHVTTSSSTDTVV